MSVLSKTNIPWARGFHTVNPYKGCGHLCSWQGVRCWAWKMADDLWGYDFTSPEPREGLKRRLEEALESAEPGKVLVSNTTDPYQPIEEDYRLTRECVRLLLEAGWTVAVLTKSSVAERDFDIFREYRDRLWFGMTLTSPEWAKKYESNASPFGDRIHTLIRARQKKIRTWVSWEPLPAYSDAEDVKTVTEYIAPGFAIFGSLNRKLSPMGNYIPLMGELYEISRGWGFPTFFKEEALRGIAPLKKRKILLQNSTPWGV